MNINELADMLIKKIEKCVDNKFSDAVKIDPAIVSFVYPSGNVDVYFPPDNDNIITNISNQSIYSLNVGDSVEILKPKGKLSNCWVIAKHSKK